MTNVGHGHSHGGGEGKTGFSKAELVTLVVGAILPLFLTMGHHHWHLWTLKSRSGWICMMYNVRHWGTTSERVTQGRAGESGFIHVFVLGSCPYWVSHCYWQMWGQQSKPCFWRSLDIMHAPYLLVILWNQISLVLTIVGYVNNHLSESVLNRKNPLIA